MLPSIRAQREVIRSELYAHGLFEYSPESLYAEDFSDVKLAPDNFARKRSRCLRRTNETAAKAAVSWSSCCCYRSLRRPNKSPVMPSPSKASVAGSGSETETASRCKNPGSSR
jgi:hypothetical protein